MDTEANEPTDPPNGEDAPPLSLARLRAAFAQMFSTPAGDDGAPASYAADEPRGDEDDAVTPEGILEALLFVGAPDDAPIPAERIAGAIRGVEPEDVPAIADRLDASLAAEGSALRVEQASAGYRLRPDESLDRVADRLRGRVRSTRLSPAAMETLSIVAYRQPIDADAVAELRGEPSGPTLEQLVRLGLLRIDAGQGDPVPGRYATTDRFLRTLGLASLEQLPRLAELED